MKKLPKIYKSYSKKELRKALLKEMQCNAQIVADNWNIVQENMMLKWLKQYKFSTKSIQDAIDSFEKIRWENNR